MKNPWMSLWLSAANKSAGAAQGLWMAEAQRQQRALAKRMTEQMTEQMAAAWTAGLGLGRKPAKRRSK